MLYAVHGTHRITRNMVEVVSPWKWLAVLNKWMYVMFGYACIIGKYDGPFAASRIC